jgi:uncharacterized membrane protein
MTWLALIYTVGFGIFWVYSWNGMSSNLNPEMQGFQIMGTVMGVVITIVFAVPLWLMIRCLRAQATRAAIVEANREPE